MVTKCAEPVLLKVFQAASHSFTNTQSFLTYLETQKGFSNTILKDYVNRSQRDTIQKDFIGDTYDVSLLYVAITLLRSTLHTDPATGKMSAKEASDSLQTHLKAVKDIRNDLIHKQSKGGTSSIGNELVNMTETLRHELREILEAMKVAYNICDSEIQNYIQRMNDDLNLIRDSPLTLRDIKNYEEQLFLTQLNQLVINKGVPELKEIYKKLSYISPLPFVDGYKISLEVDKVFTRLEIIKSGRNSSNTKIKYTEILESVQNMPSLSNNSEIGVILIEGPAGSGKTTLIKMLLHFWVARNNIITGLAEFDLLFHIDCRNPNIDTLLQLFTSLMPETAISFTDKELMMMMITDFRILFLIDGLDELNASSIQVIKQIFNLRQTCSSTIVCTSRPERITDFYKMVPHHMKIAHIKVLDIPDNERIAFAEKYHNELIRHGDSKQSTSGLTEYLKSCRLQEHLRLPLNLVMVTLLWALDPDRVNCATSASELYSQILKLYKEKLVERLKKKTETEMITVEQLKRKTDKFLSKLYDESLKSLGQDSIVMTKELTERLQNACNYIGLPSDEVTGAFLVHEEIWTNLGMEAFVSFPHKGLQDFYAAKHLFSLLRRRQPNMEITNILRDIQILLDKHDVPYLICHAVSDSVTQVMETAASTDSALTLLEIIEKECQGISMENLSKYQNVFVHLVGLLYSDGEQVSEETTKDMIQLLLKSGLTDTTQWLNILSDANCDYNMAFNMAQNFSNLVKGDLMIHDGLVTPYASLLPYVEPDSVKVKLTGPDYPPHLPRLLEELTELNTDTTLEFIHQFRHPCALHPDIDDKLQRLFERCEVAEFVGQLSVAGVRKLGNNVRDLSLSLSDYHPNLSDLQCALANVTSCEDFQHLEIHVPARTTPDALPTLPDKHPTLYVSGVTSNDLGWVGQALRQLRPIERKLRSLKFPRSHLSAGDLSGLLDEVRGAGIDPCDLTDGVRVHGTVQANVKLGYVNIPGNPYITFPHSSYFVSVEPELENWV